MAQLGFGFLRLPFAGENVDFPLLCQLVDTFLENGGTYFDTGYTYLDGLCEEMLCKTLVQRHPRDRFQIATKLPGYRVTSYEDCFRYFEESAKRCGVDYFDTYMLHWLDEKHYALAEKYREFDFLQELKRSGRAKRIGFSFHDTADLLDKILTAHPEIDCVLLQINYLDWDSPAIQSRQCYEVAMRHGKTILVMEPVKGGRLAKIPEAAAQVLQTLNPSLSPAAHAIRFVKSLPGVDTVLSGMNSMVQLQENQRSYPPLSDLEMRTMASVAQIIRSSVAVACTGCDYCKSACPMQIPISQCFSMYNEYLLYPRHQWKIVPAYNLLPVKASACIGCESCQDHCPQKLPIAEHMRQVKDVLEV